jgi:hypothetical protein
MLPLCLGVFEDQPGGCGRIWLPISNNSFVQHSVPIQKHGVPQLTGHRHPESLAQIPSAFRVLRPPFRIKESFRGCHFTEALMGFEGRQIPFAKQTLVHDRQFAFSQSGRNASFEDI